VTPSKRGRKPVPREKKRISRNVYWPDATHTILTDMSEDSGVTTSELLVSLIHAEYRRRFELAAENRKKNDD
jgi:hypothetical protein